VTGRALSFGGVAEAYERFRPGYPDELFQTISRYADRPLRTALEIGAGTGKATRLFTRHGIAVTATDPDPAMLAELRKHVPGAETVVAAFEDLPPAGPFDLVFAAAALHWTRPAGRWPRAAALLGPGGVFASFGGQFQLADPAVAEAVRVARAPFLDTDEIPSPDGTPVPAAMQWPGTELQRCELFGDVEQHVIERRFPLTRRDFVGHLSTISAYLQLLPGQREQVFDRILDALPDTVDITADLFVHLARRQPG
jgi:SAM-dependent methyltransferase